MSVEPAVFELTFRQGSTFDETWALWDDEAQTIPTVLTGWTAALKVRKDKGAAGHIISLTHGAVPPGSDGIVLADGSVRIYIRDETLAALSHTVWTDLSEGEDPAGPFTGVWDLELENPEGERFRWAQGKARFDREVTY